MFKILTWPTASERFILTFTLNVKDSEQEINLPNLKLWVTGLVMQSPRLIVAAISVNHQPNFEGLVLQSDYTFTTCPVQYRYFHNGRQGDNALAS
ncbi:transcription factor FER-LIKE IRON DEFICIENCY-INDUCED TRANSCRIPTION FACTOR [Quillaja saponaria]|uniref:Transcription factor FER-LIKE IRON DEFICIENCY-INDUCED TRANSCRIPTION FACTOR n=1 Tax=Quillaja saponaria TaxID=32244 RepID=A0AAD7KXN6_QUISA|nr:transcription factor FER-LIKE IRON DEFICIENCY-INDUCED TRANSCRIPTION FACTOR [Quillaja saponaria]